MSLTKLLREHRERLFKELGVTEAEFKAKIDDIRRMEAELASMRDEQVVDNAVCEEIEIPDTESIG